MSVVRAAAGSEMHEVPHLPRRRGGRSSPPGSAGRAKGWLDRRVKVQVRCVAGVESLRALRVRPQGV